MAYRIIGADGNEYGPVTVQQLKQWLKEGRVNSQTKVRTEGSSDWKTLGQFPELAPSQSPSPPPVEAAGKTSGMAIWSLVLGILGFFSCGTTSLPGLVLGIVGLTRINKSNGTIGGRGLAIGGICASGASVLMIPLMAAMLVPALNQARSKAQQTHCMSNIRQLGMALMMYATDNNEKFPEDARWSDSLTEYVFDNKLLECSKSGQSNHGYAFNKNLSGQSVGGTDSEVVMLFETQSGKNLAGGAELLPAKPHHPGGYVVLFSDAHVELVPASRVATLKWTPQTDQ